MSLKTDYKTDVLDTAVNSYRRYNVLNNNNVVIQSNVHFDDVTTYSQKGEGFGASDINTSSDAINQCLQLISFDSTSKELSLTALSIQPHTDITYDDSSFAVGSTVTLQSNTTYALTKDKLITLLKYGMEKCKEQASGGHFDVPELDAETVATNLWTTSFERLNYDFSLEIRLHNYGYEQDPSVVGAMFVVYLCYGSVSRPSTKTISSNSTSWQAKTLLPDKKFWIYSSADSCSQKGYEYRYNINMNKWVTTPVDTITTSQWALGLELYEMNPITTGAKSVSFITGLTSFLTVTE